jgi:hypothetical protein
MMAECGRFALFIRKPPRKVYEAIVTGMQISGLPRPLACL